MPPLRILIADDHTLFRRGLVSLLNETGDMIVVGEAGNGVDAARLAAEVRPDAILMDVNMPGGGGVEAVRRLRDVLPAAPVIMLTVSEQDDDLLGAIRAGARGYLLKNAESDELFGAIRSIVSGQAVLTSALTLRLFDYITRTPSVSSGSPLTTREAEILRLIADGNTNREIAVQLHLSENTIKTHVARILEKLETSSRAEAVALARARGWINS